MRRDDYDESSAEAGTRKERKPAAGGDLAIVQYARTLEHLETDFYNAVINSDVKPPSRAGADDRDDSRQRARARRRPHVDHQGPRGTPFKAVQPFVKS
jgi:hypothetical protein